MGFQRFAELPDIAVCRRYRETPFRVSSRPESGRVTATPSGVDWYWQAMQARAPFRGAAGIGKD